MTVPHHPNRPTSLPQADAQLREDLLPARPKGMRRGLILAIGAHALLIVALALGVNWHVSEPAGAEAELWAAVPQKSAPAAKAEVPPHEEVAAPPPPPVARPEPPPRRVVAPPLKPTADAQISVDREREKLLKERARKQEEREELRARQEQEKKDQLRRQREANQAAEKAIEDKKKQDAEHKLKQQRLQAEKEAAQAATQLAAQREAQMKRIISQAGASGGSNTAAAEKSAGPSASYTGRIIGAIRPNIWFTAEVSGNPSAEVEVRVGPDGTILGRRLTHSSGYKEWDEAVLRAIDKTEKLPRDTDGRVVPQMTLVFKPKDLN